MNMILPVKEDPNVLLSETYRPKLERLRGRKIPEVLALEGDSDPSAAVMETYGAIAREIDNPDFAIVLAYLREMAGKVAKSYHPAKASDYEMRWAAANSLIINDQIPESLVRFVAKIDGYIIDRKKHLEDKRQRAADPTMSQTTPPPP